MSLLLVVSLAAVLSACAGQAPSTTSARPADHTGMVQGTVWVANEHGNSLTAIDASSNTVITKLTGIEGPHNIKVAPDGKASGQ